MNREHRDFNILTLSILLATTLPVFANDTEQKTKAIEEDGTVHVPAFSLPFSRYASPEMPDAFVELENKWIAVDEYVKAKKAVSRGD